MQPRIINRCIRSVRLVLALVVCLVLFEAGGAFANSYDRDSLTEALELMASAEVDTLLADADLHLQRRQPGLALRLYRQVPETSSRKLRARLGEGACLFYLGKYEHSTRLLREVIAAADTSRQAQEIRATGMELLGQSYVQLGKFDIARKTFRDLAAACPERRSYSSLMIAKTHFQAGEFRSAFEMLQPILREGRYNPAYDFALDLYWKLDQRDQKKLSRLLERFLATAQKEYTGRG